MPSLTSHQKWACRGPTQGFDVVRAADEGSRLRVRIKARYRMPKPKTDGQPHRFALRKTLIDSGRPPVSAVFPLPKVAASRLVPSDTSTKPDRAPASLPAHIPSKKGMAQRNISRVKPNFNTRQVSKTTPKSIGRPISPPRINPFHELPTRSAPHVPDHHRTH